MIGIDEVGRGCWAGPLLVVAARSKTSLPVGLKDSKLLSRAQRERFSKLLVVSCDLGKGWVTPAEIDLLGLSESMRLGVARALGELEPHADEEIIIDGSIDYVKQTPEQTELHSRAVIKADSSHAIVSAASIVAKVARDQFMRDASLVHVGYGFEKHVGYGTVEHRAAIDLKGVCEIHRLSFKPIKMIVNA